MVLPQAHGALMGMLTAAQEEAATLQAALEVVTAEMTALQAAATAARDADAARLARNARQARCRCCRRGCKGSLDCGCSENTATHVV